jgi:hypothetical protein
MRLFRRSGPAIADQARAALRDTSFACAVPGVVVQLDYDASVERDDTAKWFPLRRDPRAFRYSTLADPTSRGPRRLPRAHRVLDIDGQSLHVYTMAFHDSASSLEHILPLTGRVDAQRST